MLYKLAKTKTTQISKTKTMQSKTTNKAMPGKTKTIQVFKTNFSRKTADLEF